MVKEKVSDDEDDLYGGGGEMIGRDFDPPKQSQS